MPSLNEIFWLEVGHLDFKFVSIFRILRINLGLCLGYVQIRHVPMVVLGQFAIKAKIELLSQITGYPLTFWSHDHIVGHLAHTPIYQNLKKKLNLTHCVTCNFNSSPFLDTLQFSGSHVYQNRHFDIFLAPEEPLEHAASAHTPNINLA